MDEVSEDGQKSIWANDIGNRLFSFVTQNTKWPAHKCLVLWIFWSYPIWTLRNEDSHSASYNIALNNHPLQNANAHSDQ